MIDEERSQLLDVDKMDGDELCGLLLSVLHVRSGIDVSVKFFSVTSCIVADSIEVDGRDRLWWIGESLAPCMSNHIRQALRSPGQRTQFWE